MNAKTRNDEMVSRAQADTAWMSRLSLRASSQYDEGSGALGHLPGGSVARTVALCCVLALTAVALRGLAVQGQPEAFASARPSATDQARTLPAGD